MTCPKCDNDAYPAEFTEVVSKAKDKHIVKTCKRCGYPILSQEARVRIAEKLMLVRHLVLSAPNLKKIDLKYIGETLDKERRPLEELAELRKVWDEKWSNNQWQAPNFYDWVGTIKASARVLQLNAEERVDYIVNIKDGDLSGEYVQAKYSDYAFVLDAVGNFYAAPKQTSGDVRIHHSSFMSGSPVQCAGVFFCNKVKGEHTKSIFYVKDYSGHYQPGIPEVLRLKHRLTELGEGDINLWYYGGGVSPKYKGPIKDFTGKGEDFKGL